MSASVNVTDMRRETIAARRVLKSRGVRSLLSRPTANPKVTKNLKVGVLTAPLHLSPASLSGFNVCPMATAGCLKACLHTAGNPVYMRGKAKSRNARTQAYFETRAAFMIVLVAEIATLERKAKAAGLKCGVRLNATSDIPWERVAVTIGRTTFTNVMQVFPDVTFYDYTKRPNRRNLPRNYRLTFSLAENNDGDALRAIANGMNVAAVFDTRRNRDLPKRFTLQGDVGLASPLAMSLRVIDGDVHDFRPVDRRGVIVGLRAKGQAIGDASGFVRAAASI